MFSSAPDEAPVAAENSPKKTVNSVEHTYKLIDNEDEMRRLVDFLFTQPILSLDTETTSTHPIDAELVGLSFAAEPHTAYYVPVPADEQ